MKKLLIFACFIVLATGLLAGGSMKLLPKKVVPGQEVTVAVEVALPAAPLSAEFQMVYDTSILDFVKMEKGPLAADAMHALNDQGGVVRAAFAAAEPFPSGTGVLCTLTFKVKAKAAKDTRLQSRKALLDDSDQGSTLLKLDLATPVKTTN